MADHQLAEPRSKGDQIQLIFDADDYLKRSPSRRPDSGRRAHQDGHVIIVNKPEGMKTHANEPTEIIALLNHVSAMLDLPKHVCTA